MVEKIQSLLSKTSTMRLDVMMDGRWQYTTMLKVIPNTRYRYEELKEIVRFKYGYSKDKEFDIFPCEKLTFRY